MNSRLTKQINRMQQGFTIIELLIATLVFSTILIVLTFGVVHISQSYYKGLANSQTQNAARDILNNISQAIQLGGTSAPVGPLSAGGVSWVCVGPNMFTYEPGLELVSGVPSAAQHQTNYGLIFSTLTTSCPTTGSPPNITTLKGQELLSNHMRISELSITPLNAGVGGQGLYRISVQVSDGDDPLLCNNSVTIGGVSSCTSIFAMPTLADYLNSASGTVLCKGQAGDQFCSTSHLATVVQARYQTNAL